LNNCNIFFGAVVKPQYLTTPNTLAAEQSASISNPYINAATSANTRRAYQADIRHFETHGGTLPAQPKHIIQYLMQFAGSLNARTLSRRIVALRNWHCYQGFADPTSVSEVSKTLAGIIRTHGQPKEKATPLLPDDLLKIVIRLECDGSLRALRDNALLQVGFCGAFRRSELVAIKVEHISWRDQGIEILVPHSKTDQENRGELCALPRGRTPLCPITALEKWLTAAKISDGFVFRTPGKNNTVREKPLTSGAISLILRRHARAASIEYADSLSSHSLRRGLATSAATKGATLPAIMRQGRWKHVNTVIEYIEAAQRFEDNAADIAIKSVSTNQENIHDNNTVSLSGKNLSA
jgi:integrase